MDFTDYIKTILSPLGVAIAFIVRPEPKPCISFHMFGEDGALYGDGDVIHSGGSLQIDIFGPDTKVIRGLRKKVIAAFEAENQHKKVLFYKTTPDEMTYEKDTRLYHQVVVFNFTIVKEME